MPVSTHSPFTDGVLGLAYGKSSIVSQLSGLGYIRNVVGHCLSAQGGGFLFFGDDVLPSSEIAWRPIEQTSSEYVLCYVIGLVSAAWNLMKKLMHFYDFRKHYSLGPAELLFDGQATGIKSLPIIFDSGSTFTYFSSKAYDIFLSSVSWGSVVIVLNV